MIMRQKEAISKFFGEGLSMGFNSFSVLPLDRVHTIKGKEVNFFVSEIDNMPLSAAYVDNSEFEITELFPNNVPKRLERNFRNTRRILQFCQACFRQANISMQDIMSCRALGELPQLFVTENRIFGGQDGQQDEAIKEIIRDNQGPTHNIAILCPWGKTVDYFYNLIKDDFEDVTFYYRQGNQEKGCEELGNIHVTTFKSAKGLEFDTVIIPNFQNVDEDLERFHVNWKDFYVGVTRSRTNLFLISDPSCSMVNSQYVETNEL